MMASGDAAKRAVDCAALRRLLSSGQPSQGIESSDRQAAGKPTSQRVTPAAGFTPLDVRPEFGCNFRSAAF